MTWLLTYAPILNLGLLVMIFPFILYLYDQLQRISLAKFYEKEINAVRARADRLQDDSERLMGILEEMLKTTTKQTEAMSKLSDRTGNEE